MAFSTSRDDAFFFEADPTQRMFVNDFGLHDLVSSGSTDPNCSIIGDND